MIDEAAWQAGVSRWLPTADDRTYVQSLMGRVIAPGQFANWIAPPTSGINGQPVDFQFVRFN
jgi:benzoyl-CoA 2,3-epoxidase subunit B